MTQSTRWTIPEVVVQRLPLYVRSLGELRKERVSVVSSQELGKKLQITPAQIRKDLSYFGRFGKQGKGYNVAYLLEELRRILYLDREWRVVLVGVGRLGRAVVSYPGFAPEGFKVVAAFDESPDQVGQKVGNLTVRPVTEMEHIINSDGIKIAIVAVPASQAGGVINRLIDYGIKAILNYAPISVDVPKDVTIRNIDPVLALQSMTFYLRSPRVQGPDGRVGKA